MAIDDKFDEISTLVQGSKKRGFRSEEESGEMLPTGLHSTDDLDELLTSFGRRPGV